MLLIGREMTCSELVGLQYKVTVMGRIYIVTGKVVCSGDAIG